MPKDRRSRSLSFERQLVAPYPCHSTACQKNSSSSSSSSSSRQSTEVATSEADIKEWEEARCSVCMEHPHNAVLLLCSSHDKGCRPYMCDTSYRHSNCLDQFRKAFAGDDASCPENSVVQEQTSKLSCPLCRGEVTDWTVVEPARQYMNAKARVCSLESCGYSGAYRELRKHARTEHPSVRPSDADPERQRNWRRMERQRDIEDLLSTIRPLFADDGMAVVSSDVGARVLDSRQQFFYCVMIIRLHQRQEDVGAASNSSHPQVFVTFGSRRPPTRRHRRRRSHAELGEEAAVVVAAAVAAAAAAAEASLEEGDHSDGNDDGDGEELPPLLGGSGSTASPHHAAATRRRRRMRIPDEEDVV